jgi:hypothetical protein
MSRVPSFLIESQATPGILDSSSSSSNNNNNNNNNNNSQVDLSCRGEKVKYLHLQRIQQISL